MERLFAWLGQYRVMRFVVFPPVHPYPNRIREKKDDIVSPIAGSG